MVLDLGPKRAVPVSKATILGVALGNIMFIAWERHPQDRRRPLIAYDVAVLMQAGVLLGVLWGVILNLMLPEVIIVTLLAIVLGFTAYKTIGKGITRWRAETAAEAAATIKESNDAQMLPNDQKDVEVSMNPTRSGEGLEMTEASSVDQSVSMTPVDPRMEEDAEEMRLIVAEEQQLFPRWAWVSLAMMTAFLIMYSLFINGFFISNVSVCEPGLYWPLYWLPTPFFGALMLLFARRNYTRHLRKQALNYKFLDGDLHWSWRSTLSLQPAAIVAGMVAGCLGIGGGMILGPLFLSLNLHPQVVTATTGFMLLWTASAGTIQYLTVGKLPWRFALFFGMFGVLGGQIGQRVVKRIVGRTGRPSIVIFLLGSIIALAVLLMTVIGVTTVIDKSRGGEAIFRLDLGPFTCDYV